MSEQRLLRPSATPEKLKSMYMRTGNPSIFAVQRIEQVIQDKQGIIYFQVQMVGMSAPTHMMPFFSAGPYLKSFLTNVKVSESLKELIGQFSPEKM